MNLRRFLVYLAFAGAVVALYASLAASRSFAGYPLDDAWIHQTYARNWAETRQLAYVVGSPSAGSTAPLWTLLLSVAYRLNIDPYLWSLILGAVFLAISAWLLSRLAERLFHASRRSIVSWLTGLACVLEWHLIWAAASGMETLLFIVLALALIDRMWAESSGWIIGVLGGLLILTRPEGLLLFVIALGVVLICPREGARPSVAAFPRRDAASNLAKDGEAFASSAKDGEAFASPAKDSGAFARNLREVTKAAIAFVIVLAPGAYFNLRAGGSIFPNTFYAKQSEYGELMRTLPIWLNSIANMLIAPLAGGGLLLMPGVVVWVIRNRHDVKQRVRWMWWLPLMWAVAHISVYALRLPVSYQHGRYLLPIIPIILLYGVVGTALLLDALKARQARPLVRLARQVYFLVVVILFGGYIPIGALTFGTDVAIINGEMVTVAQWLDRNTPPNALIAAHDIGAIGYFARRPILDLAGLISPEVIPFIRDEAKLSEWMKAKGAQYLVTFPGWYPQMSASPDLVELFQGRSTFSPEHMTVYALAR